MDLIKRHRNLMDEPIKKKRKRVIWTDEAVLTLIDLWRNKLQDLWKTRRNSHVYEEMASCLREQNMEFTAAEVHIKISNLTQRYKQEKNAMASLGGTSCWNLYDQVHAILGSTKFNDLKCTYESLSQEETMDIMTPFTTSSIKCFKTNHEESSDSSFPKAAATSTPFSALNTKSSTIMTTIPSTSSLASKPVPPMESKPPVSPIASNTVSFAASFRQPSKSNAAFAVRSRNRKKSIDKMMFDEIRRCNHIAEEEMKNHKILLEEIRRSNDIAEDESKTYKRLLERSLRNDEQITEVLQDLLKSKRRT